MLPSFPALRRKNLETIYGHSNSDRSPKGSIDQHIQNFVDCINQHPRYVTLSSCSGRISLFDPTKHSEPGDDNNDDTTCTALLDDNHDSDIPFSATRTTTTSTTSTPTTPETHGKGGSGGWLFVSHDLITPSDMEPYMLGNNNNNTNSTASPSSCSPLLLFQFEAFLLHVAAASLADGQRLLQTALASGLRESGLIVTERRVTVALRTTRFRLAVPITAAVVVNCMSMSYLWDHLVAHANTCLTENWALMHRVHGAVEQLLFPQPRVSVRVVASAAGEKKESFVKLYGHTAAVQPNHGTITVIGGYGVADHGSRRRGRSDAVYCRTRSATAWSQLRHCHYHHPAVQPQQPQATVATIHGPLRVQPLPSWSGRHGAAAAPLGGVLDGGAGAPLPAVLLFGGRYGPSQPLGDLVMMLLLGEDQCSFVSITNVHGPIPSPRWGHTLTATTRTDQSATSWILVGGRNAKCAVDDVAYRGSLLPVTSSPTGEAAFVWERLDTLKRIPPVFHHAAVNLRDGPSVFVFGGLSSVRHCSTQLQLAAIITPDGVERLNDAMLALPYRFGHQMNVIPHRMSALTWILVSGGVTSNDNQSIVTCLQLSPSSKPNKPPTLRVVPVDSQLQDAGVLVHHCAIEVAPGTLLLLGGGVPGFAFGDAWARSTTVTVKVQWQDDYCDDATSIVAVDKQESPALINTSTTVKQSPSKVSVLYARKIDAKGVKDALQKASLLDKNHRITSVDPQGVEESCATSEPLDWMNHVAIPVVAFDKSWRDWPGTAGCGHQECPLSTRKFASRNK